MELFVFLCVVVLGVQALFRRKAVTAGEAVWSAVRTSALLLFWVLVAAFVVALVVSQIPAA